MIIPSEKLIDLARTYLNIVDNGTPEEQEEPRTKAHNALIRQMLEEGIALKPNRAQVRWLARFLVESDWPQREPVGRKRTQIMFVRIHRGEDHPVFFEAHQLVSVPPFDESEESLALQFYVPVRVTIEPWLHFEEKNEENRAVGVGL